LRAVIDGRYINDACPGIGRYTFNLIAAMAQSAGDDQLVVMVNSRLRNRRYDLARLAAVPSCRLVDCRVDRYLPAEVLGLAPEARRLRPDLFHSPYFLRPYPLAVPCINTIYDLFPMQMPGAHSRLERLVFYVGIRMAMRRSKAILTISGFTADALRALWPEAAGRVFITPLAPDPWFRRLPETEGREAVRHLGLEERPYVFHVSSGMPHKNIGLLLRAWCECIRRPHIARHRLVLAGNYGRWHAQIAALAKQLDLGDSAVFLGDVDDRTLLALYNGAELFVFPSRMEGFGLPVLEAMACATPVLTTASVCAAAGVGDAAWSIQTDALEPLVAALDRLLSDEGLRRTLAGRGLICSQGYTWQETAKKTWHVYKTIARRGK
jgi:glycosyltransferase involved in cell wall biosynthesis